MLSLRRVGQQAVWSVMSEFEDIIIEVDHVHRIDLKCAKGRYWRRRAVEGLVWRDLNPVFAKLNAGLQPVTLEREYDILAYVCLNPWDLLSLNAVRGWREKCRKKVCFIFEIWAGLISQYKPFLSLLKDFDHVFLGFKSSVPPVQKLTDTPCHFVPPASDTLRFSPYPNPPERSIDVFSLGRRSEKLHDELFEMAENREIFYVYDTIPGRLVQPIDQNQHRSLFANLAKRSRFFITYPAKVDQFEETQGMIEPGTRFYEGVATGAVLIGEAPHSEAFDRDFNWPDSVISIGERIDEFRDILSRYRRDPDTFNAVTRRNVREALKRHDWAHRWKEILEISGEIPSQELTKRLSRLDELAATV